MSVLNHWHRIYDGIIIVNYQLSISPCGSCPFCCACWGKISCRHKLPCSRLEPKLPAWQSSTLPPDLTVKGKKWAPNSRLAIDYRIANHLESIFLGQAGKAKCTVYRSTLSTNFGSDNTHLLSTAEQYGHQLIHVEVALFLCLLRKDFVST